MMDPTTQSRLIKASKAVISLVNDGTTPTEALVKVAQSSKLGPEHVRRVAEAYNVSRSLANHQQKQGEARLAPFDLADADKALRELFPRELETAGQKSAAVRTSTACYEVPNLIERIRHHEKAAFVIEPKAEPAAAPTFNKQAAAQVEKDLRRLKDEMGEAQVRLPALLDKAASDVRKSLHQLPFERLEQCLVARMGKSAGVKLADLLWELTDAKNLNQKRASQFGAVLQDYALSPFDSIDAMVTATLNVQNTSRRYKQAKSQAQPQKKEATAPVTCFRKDAFFDVTGKVLDRSFKGLTEIQDTPRYQAALANAMDRVQNPDARDAAAAAKLKAMAQDLLLNDEVISRYDPEEVLERFNEIAQLSPQVVQQPMLVRGLLRRALVSGGVDPFEAAQVAGVGRTLADGRKPDNSMLEAITQDASSLRPDLVQSGGRSLGQQGVAVFSGGFGAKFRDPRLALQQAELRHRQGTDKAKFKRDDAWRKGDHEREDSQRSADQRREDQQRFQDAAGRELLSQQDRKSREGVSSADRASREQMAREQAGQQERHFGARFGFDVAKAVREGTWRDEDHTREDQHRREDVSNRADQSAADTFNRSVKPEDILNAGPAKPDGQGGFSRKPLF